MTEAGVDLDRLLKLRLIVGRFGEMDLAKWWNTGGQLGRLGTAAVRRGLPRTHYFAQARAVFAVAAHRCREVFDPPGSVTLWNLPAQIDEAFDARWEYWLDQANAWVPFFQKLSEIAGDDLARVLRSFELLTQRDEESVARLQRSAEGRAVSLPHAFAGNDENVTLLALGFTRGAPGALAVPYARSEDA